MEHKRIKSTLKGSKGDWAKSLEKIDVKNKELYNNIDVISVLKQNNIVYTVVSKKWIKMKCLYPDHNDNTPSMYIDIVNKGYNCYGCARTGNIYKLFIEIGFDVGLSENNIIGVMHGNIWENFRENIALLTDKNTANIKKCHKPNGFKIIAHDDVLCKRHYRYLKNRELLNLIDTFKIGYTILTDKEYSGNYLSRIIIPIHDINGKMIWCEGRIINTDIKVRKYYRPFGVKKENILFNYFRVNKMKYRWVILVEGIIDAMLLHSWGFPAVAIFGTKISDYQLELLMSFDKIYLCLDSDDAGIKGYKSAKTYFMSVGIELYRIILPYKKDIADIGFESFEKRLFRSKRIY